MNGIVVTDVETREYNIAVKDEKIVKVVPRGSLSGSLPKRTVDAQGGLCHGKFPIYFGITSR